MRYKNKINYPNLTVSSSSGTFGIFDCFSQIFPATILVILFPCLPSLKSTDRPVRKKNVKNYNITLQYFKITRGGRGGEHTRTATSATGRTQTLFLKVLTGRCYKHAATGSQAQRPGKTWSPSSRRQVCTWVATFTQCAELHWVSFPVQVKRTRSTSWTMDLAQHFKEQTKWSKELLAHVCRVHLGKLWLQSDFHLQETLSSCLSCPKISTQQRKSTLQLHPAGRNPAEKWSLNSQNRLLMLDTLSRGNMRLRILCTLIPLESSASMISNEPIHEVESQIHPPSFPFSRRDLKN